MFTGSVSMGVYAGSPDTGFSIHGGGVYFVDASNIKDSIVGLSEYHSAGGELEEAGLESGISGTLFKGVKNLSDNPDIWVPGGNCIDPVLDRTVDGVALNVSAGVDIQVDPVVPYDGTSSHGYSQTYNGWGYNIYSIAQNAWNWLTDW